LGAWETGRLYLHDKQGRGVDASDFRTALFPTLEQLAQLMIDHDVGVTEESRYIVKKIDLDYFSDE
jgi:restriction endonuclease Mrr